jgi:hypothetical protein
LQQSQGEPNPPVPDLARLIRQGTVLPTWLMGAGIALAWVEAPVFGWHVWNDPLFLDEGRLSKMAGIFGATLVILAAFAMVRVLVFRRSVIQHVLGIEIVTADGELASRGRMIARTAIAWLAPLLIALGLDLIHDWLVIAWAAAMLVLALLPGRGLHDRLAGTWLVPG